MVDESTLTDDDFAEVVLSKVNPDTPLPTDVYLKVDGKYIRFKEKGDTINAEKYNLFISKGVTDIYISASEIMVFLEWINKSREDEVDEQVGDAGEESRGFFQSNQETKEKVYDTFFEDELNEEIVDKLQGHVSDFVTEINKNPITAQAIAALAKRNSTIADHSVNVANLAVYIAMSLGHGHQFVLENIYMGALFHDYGKAKIPANVLENTGDRMYSQAIQDHPDTGLKIVSKTAGIPKQVLQIIAQHHEQFNGHGFPKGLNGDEVYELAQIVSMANIFDNTLYEHRQKPTHDKYKRALKVVEYDKGKNWNPKLVPRALEALKLAFDKNHDSVDQAS